MKNAVKLLCALGALFLCLPTSAQLGPKLPKKPIKIVKPTPGIKKPGPRLPRTQRYIPSNVINQRVATHVQRVAKKYVTPTMQSHSLNLQHDILASSVGSRTAGDYGALQEGLGYSNSFPNARKQVLEDIKQGIRTYPSRALLMADIQEYLKKATPNTVVNITVVPEYSKLPLGHYEVFEIPLEQIFPKNTKRRGRIKMENGERDIVLNQRHEVILRPLESTSSELHILDRDQLFDVDFAKSVPSSIQGQQFASASEFWTALGGKQQYSLVGDLFEDLKLFFVNQSSFLKEPMQPLARVEYQIDGHTYDVYDLPTEDLELFGQSKLKEDHTICLVRADQLAEGKLLPGSIKFDFDSMLQNHLLYKTVK
ncbi:MAG: hypothetical protein J6Y25_01455 [Elusimicrobiaceae bacterium]|nr:hypothetical protein [Elusimicrobiaceae bacterium]MBP5617314.1 hypothetical protein [Elusimicrobiaceae bacterium]